jgi:hypothetical protein
VTFSGTNGSTIPSGTTVVRGDGRKFTTTTAIVVTDPCGLLGGRLRQQAAAGSLMAPRLAIAGVNSSGTVAGAFTGGASIEAEPTLRAHAAGFTSSRCTAADLQDGWRRARQRHRFASVRCG